ncbi:MAG TPA: ABC transporter ATP-binding protein [Acidimicrobiales bacterium]|nr:ABC transporter ATP-binding protein [Acidimicrobiales bacterium]
MALLEVKGIDVRFGGRHALRAVDLAVEGGRITGLIGPNGAGKTTLFDVITGLRDPDTGSVVLDGRDITRMPPHRRARLGLARTFQRLEIFGSLTVSDNIRVAAEMAGPRRRSTAAAAAEADGIVARMGLTAVAGDRADSLPTGSARLVELGRALATRPRALLLDEPASGLDDAESDVLGALLVQLAAEGTAVLLVEHDVALVMRVCEWIHVLDAGSMLAAGPPAEIRASPAVLDAYLGTAVPGEHGGRRA